MSEPAWKAFERTIGDAIDGGRHWANSGEAVDCSSHYACVQCKLVKTLSLEALTQLAETTEAQAIARQKPLGIVAVKRRRGRGKPSEPLIVMTLASWLRLREELPMALRFGENVPVSPTVAALIDETEAL